MNRLLEAFPQGVCKALRVITEESLVLTITNRDRLR